ncbi:NAD(P)/FAD-dependent oxidoreductase [Ferrimonas balearica]|nr:NAD(P)/FAD-dependent oxidoreductase [Ferrimonas balearica]
MSDPLNALAAAAQAQIDALSYPRRPWVTPRQYKGQPVLDVAIVGGGQSGLSIAFGLMRENVTNIRLYDRNRPGEAGPWTSYARMQTLRTPKHVSGPEMGIPALTPEAWYRARYGDAAWEVLDKIPKAQWQDYLGWVAGIVGQPVFHGVEVVDLEPLDGGITAIRLRDRDGHESVDYARAVVLAPGIEATGAWAVPEFVRDALPDTLYAHTAETIDFAALAGKRVAVLGGGASAFDNAACALEAGAAKVDLFVRRPKLPPVNPYRWMEYTGFLRHFPDLDDATKWEFMQTIFRMNQPPPQDTFNRCHVWQSFGIHYDSPFTALAHVDGQVQIATPQGSFDADFLIVGTGMAIDPTLRPELARLAPGIATWADRFAPAAGPEAYGLGAYPYLGDAFQFRGRDAAADAVLSRHYCYTFAAMVSQGCSAGISALKFGAERVVRGITRQLFTEDAAEHLATLRAYDEPELRPETAPLPHLTPETT